MKGQCCKCGRIIPPSPERNVELEEEILALAAELNQRAHGEVVGPYLRVVQERLAWGEEKFGSAYLERDNLIEACEESPDASAYLLLELQRLMGRGLGDQEFQELRMATVGAVSAAIHLDVAIRRVATLRRELLGI